MINVEYRVHRSCGTMDTAAHASARLLSGAQPYGRPTDLFPPLLPADGHGPGLCGANFVSCVAGYNRNQHGNAADRHCRATLDPNSKLAGDNQAGPEHRSLGVFLALRGYGADCLCKSGNPGEQHGKLVIRLEARATRRFHHFCTLLAHGLAQGSHSVAPAFATSSSRRATQRRTMKARTGSRLLLLL